MKKTIIYENIGFGKYPNSEIRIENNYTDSNDYEYTDVVVDGEWWSHDLSAVDAIEKAFDDDPETAEWLIDKEFDVYDFRSI